MKVADRRSSTEDSLNHLLSGGAVLDLSKLSPNSETKGKKKQSNSHTSFQETRLHLVDCSRRSLCGCWDGVTAICNSVSKCRDQWDDTH